MKVLILSNFGAGLYKFRKELIKDLISKKHDVIIAYPEDEFASSFVELGCTLINTKLDRRGMNPVKDFILLIQYIKLIKSLRPNVVLTYTIKPNIYGGIACRITKTKYITTITGLGSAIENEGIVRKITLNLYKLALRSAQLIFFQNKKNKKIFEDEDIINGLSQVISGSGVNISEFNYEPYPSSSESIELLYAGRIMKDKGINELLAAISIIKAKYRNVNFTLVGFCEEEYDSKLNDMKKKGLLEYYGKQDDIFSYIKQSHAIVLPSYHEGLSNVLLEGAATGRPVIASNIPGCIETFDDNVSGFSFEIKSTDSLVKALEKFIKLDAAVKANMGVLARKKIETEFNRKFVVSKYIDAIEKVGK